MSLSLESISNMQKRYTTILAALATVALSPICHSQSLDTILQTGHPSNRVDMLILGDGYTQAQIDSGTYDGHIQTLLDYHFASSPDHLADPFPRYKNFFNVHKIDTPSQESGADIPNQAITVDTALDATFGTTTERLLTISTGLANAARNTALSGTGVTADLQYVTVNTSKYGGSGGSYGVYAGANSSSLEVALHEAGHSFSDLADEYDYGGPTVYAGGEPSEVNVTKDASGAKWNRWSGFDDPRGSNLDIGAFEGARYSEEGIYRPSSNSKMRNLNRPFDAVSREKIILDFYDHVQPLDDWLPGTFISGQPLWVDTVDPNVIKVDWYVDDQLVAPAAGDTFDPTQLGLATGQYEVRAHAYDQVVNHAFEGGLLDLVRKDLDKLQQEVSWTVFVAEPARTYNSGDYNGDLHVNAADYPLWRDTLGDSVESFTAADGDGSGTVDQADYAHWRNQFGKSLQTRTLIDPETANGSFEEVDGASLPLIAQTSEAEIPGWTAVTTFAGGWNNAIEAAASDGENYALAAPSATLLLTSDPLLEHLTQEGDQFSLALDVGSSNGILHDYEVSLQFGENQHLLSIFSEGQNAAVDGLNPRTFEYLASTDDAGFNPVVQIMLTNTGNFSQAFIDNVRLSVATWGFENVATGQTVPEPTGAMSVFAFVGLMVGRRNRRGLTWIPQTRRCFL